jgi:ADP-ribose pyrophosphatase YjhB (NUDIX family)
LLWLWKVLPIPTQARRTYLELTHPRFLIGVMALIRDGQGRVLVLEHTYRRDFTWGLPGGYLQTREAPEAGLTREVAEELGLRVEIGNLLAAGLYTPYQLDLLYEARVVAGEPRPSNEVCAWRYAEMADLANILPNQRHMLMQSGLA